MSVLGDKRLILTVTSGRSGTGYLAKVLAVLPGVCAYHEPEPFFHDWMRRVQKEANLAEQWLRDEKLPAIKKCNKSIYIETSHLFCKGFFEPLIGLGVIPDLILLSRPHREVASSLYGLNTIPGRGGLGERFYLSPDDSGVLLLPEWKDLHDYQLCYWYCLEIERRQYTYGKEVQRSGGRVVAINLAEANTPEGFERLRQELELPEPGLFGRLQLRKLRKSKVNDKSHKKKQKLSEEEKEQLETDLLALISTGRG